MKKLADFILKVLGWQVTDHSGNPPKCVICVAPHTSNFDFLWGQIAYLHLDRHAGFLMKRSWFFPPIGFLLRAIGGIPVDRTRKTSLTEQMSTLFAQRNRFHLAITPEATRKANPEWRKGFYFIAKVADVPIVPAAIDYGKKHITLFPPLATTDDADADIERLKDLYSADMARYPEKFAR